jgi:Na+-transporting methylmalonyl-CoA/oxaloacetate decarboxylase gamma subunit
MNVTGMILEALKLMGIGVGSVFVVLSLFFFMVKGLVALFPEKPEKE